MTQDSIENQLNNIKRWHFIPGKNRITPVLESMISRDEYIIDIIDGFFPAEPGIKNSRDDSGLILVTDRTVILIRSELPDKLIVLKKDKILSVTCNLNFSSLAIQINYGKNNYTFVTHLSELAVKNIFSAAVKPVQKENSSSGSSANILPSPLLEKTEEDGTEQIPESNLLHSSELIQNEIHSADITPEKPVDDSESIEQVMEKINALVGMENIKEEIKSFINFVNIRTERGKRKLPVTPLSLHAVFYGPPGTGKTTIARLLGRVYKALGLLSSGHLVETDRAGLVAGYVGQTAIKTDELVMKAKDGVLFIDEAYTLAPENSANDFGRESIDTILKRMEDMREGFAVIAAGYTDEMERFINSNPGLKSRFSRYFYFDHYTPEELVKIFNIFADNVEFKLSGEADVKLKELISYFYDKRNRSFGNARFVRNVFDKIVQNQADRLSKITALTNELLCEVAEEDIPLKENFNAEQFV